MKSKILSIKRVFQAENFPFHSVIIEWTKLLAAIHLYLGVHSTSPRKTAKQTSFLKTFPARQPSQADALNCSA
jgi:hypothetical protein